MGGKVTKPKVHAEAAYEERQTHILALQALRELRDAAAARGSAEVTLEQLRELVDHLEEASAVFADQQGALAAIRAMESTLLTTPGNQADTGIRDFLLSNYTAKRVRIKAGTRQSTRRTVQVAMSTHEWVTRLATIAEVTEASLPDFRGVMTDFDAWHFDIFRFASLVTSGPIQAMGYAIVEAHGLFEELGLERETLIHFCALLDGAYLDNMYHNRLHGADVGQGMHYMLKSGGLSRYLSRNMKYACIIAALSHDVAHPGLNNPFLVAASHDLALTYNDKSPLENMHVSLAFKLMQTPGCNIVESFEPADLRYFRSSMIEMVLATDNAMHAAYLGRLTKAIEIDGCDIEQPDNLILFMSNLVHAVDVSNPTKQFGLYMTWTNRLVEEFFVQGDQEKALGLPVTPIMNRAAPVPMENLQAGFIKAIVLPLYKAMSNISFLDIRVPVASLEGNLAHWENIIRSKSQAAAAPPKPTAGSPRASSTRSISASKASGDHDDAKDATPDKRD